MKILVINCGSSSIKYQFLNMTDSSVLAIGVIEKIGLKGSFLKFTTPEGQKVRLEGEIIDHQAGIEFMLGVLTSKNYGCIKDYNDIDAIGHRVVHGGEKFAKSVFIDEDVKKTMIELIQIAPLHNPANLKGIDAIESILPNHPQVGVFDTAFHQTMPDYAYMYAIPYSLYTKYGIRRYGFHGTSHRYVSEQACEHLGVAHNKQKIITCHLGNGASITAIKNGKSVDTSMGLTPVEGLIMGTRSGDLDIGVLNFIMNKEEVPGSTLNTIVNKHSGMLGITGISSDMREIEIAAEEGHERSILGMNMYRYRIMKYIGAYTAAMGGVDLIVFTGGIGENDPVSREIISTNFEYLGVVFDKELNAGKRGKKLLLTKPESKVKIMVVPTNEELVIAQDTKRIIEEMNK